MQKSDPVKRFDNNVHQVIISVNLLDNDFAVLDALSNEVELHLDVLTPTLKQQILAQLDGSMIFDDDDDDARYLFVEAHKHTPKPKLLSLQNILPRTMTASPLATSQNDMLCSQNRIKHMLCY